MSANAGYYFAYGSNMNPDRVRARRMGFDCYHGGVLADYRFAFNKRSTLYPGAASANVQPVPGHAVEGVLYRLSSADAILAMDPFEGYPERYDRVPLPVAAGGRTVAAWVYIANPAFIAEGMRPARWYLEHLLKGAPFLTAAYYRRLLQTECLPDSGVEPQ